MGIKQYKFESKVIDLVNRRIKEIDKRIDDADPYADAVNAVYALEEQKSLLEEIQSFLTTEASNGIIKINEVKMI